MKDREIVRVGCIVFGLAACLAIGVVIVALILSLRGTQLRTSTGGGQTGGLCSVVPPAYQQIFFNNARGDIPPSLLAAIFYEEHGYVVSYKPGYTPTNQKNDKWPEKDGDPTAIIEWQTSSAGALGPMQFMPATWAQYGGGGDVQNINDASLGTARKAQADYDKQSGNFDEKLKKVIALYNPGAGPWNNSWYVDEVWDLYLKFNCAPSGAMLAGRMDVPFIDQRNRGWCGRASQAMVIAFFDRGNLPKYDSLAFLSDHLLSDATVASFSHQNYHYARPSLDAVINSLASGYPAIVYTDFYDQHIFVLTGYDPATETFWANDTFSSAEGGAPKDTQVIDGIRLTKGNLQSHLMGQPIGQPGSHTFIYVP